MRKTWEVVILTSIADDFADPLGRSAFKDDFEAKAEPGLFGLANPIHKANFAVGGHVEYLNIFWQVPRLSRRDNIVVAFHKMIHLLLPNRVRFNNFSERGMARA